MRSIIPLLSLSALLVPVQSLYFYIDGTTPKCFFEELPKDTLVVGHYKAEEYDENRKIWSSHDGLNIFISVDVCPLEKSPSINPFPTSLNFSKSKSDLYIGSIRQRPPCHLPKRLVFRSLYLHRRRLRRPQDLLHALLQLWRPGMALSLAPHGRHQAYA
jgi:hypothetical protein